MDEIEIPAIEINPQDTVLKEAVEGAFIGRPIEYTPEVVTRAKEYITLCVDEIEEYHKTRGIKSDSYDRIVRVKLPTIEGLAVHLGIHKDTVYDWEKKYTDFSDVLAILRSKQADALINNGLSGDYNPTIAKVLLTKHGYREAVDSDLTTGGDKLNINVVSYNANTDDTA